LTHVANGQQLVIDNIVADGQQLVIDIIVADGQQLVIDNIVADDVATSVSKTLILPSWVGRPPQVLVHRLGQDLPSSVARVVHEDLQDTVCPKSCRLPKRIFPDPFEVHHLLLNFHQYRNSPISDNGLESWYTLIYPKSIGVIQISIPSRHSRLSKPILIRRV
jgi:hypothetical protein